MFSAEAWFRTTSNRGGKLLGFGSSQLGSSGSYDRQVYMRSDGRLVFGVYPGSIQTVVSPAGYNNGAWHHVVASLGAAGLQLFVDGSMVANRADVTSGQAYTGYWRLGSDSLSGWPNVTSSSFQGDLDEFAVYDRQLPASEVLDATGWPVPLDHSPPSTPTITSGGAGGTTVALAWSTSTDDIFVSGYQVHRLAAPGDAPDPSTLVTTVTGTSVTIPGVAAGTSYWRVVAIDASATPATHRPPARSRSARPRRTSRRCWTTSPDLYWPLNDSSGTHHRGADRILRHPRHRSQPGRIGCAAG